MPHLRNVLADDLSEGPRQRLQEQSRRRRLRPSHAVRALAVVGQAPEDLGEGVGRLDRRVGLLALALAPRRLAAAAEAVDLRRVGLPDRFHGLQDKLILAATS